MADIKGIFAEIKTSSSSNAGTDDDIYVGIFGKGGGSEFPIDVRWFNDLETGSNEKYWLGDIWEGSVLTGAIKPYGASGWNDPELRHIELDKVDYVYLRKESHKGSNDDDAWKMDQVEVTLYGPNSPLKRTFHKTGDIWLGNEYGLQVWLKEQ